ncbi:MAG: hypothetical protein V1701_02625 [Planctomycetota bacterium]
MPYRNECSHCGADDYKVIPDITVCSECGEINSNKTISICSRCGSESDSGVSCLLATRRIEIRLSQKDGLDKTIYMELCDKCDEELNIFLDKFGEKKPQVAQIK